MWASGEEGRTIYLDGHHQALERKMLREAADHFSNARPIHLATKDLILIRCDRGAEIARQLGFPPETAEAIRSLDEHWCGLGYARGLGATFVTVLKSQHVKPLLPSHTKRVCGQHNQTNPLITDASDPVVAPAPAAPAPEIRNVASGKCKCDHPQEDKGNADAKARTDKTAQELDHRMSA